MKYLNDDTAFRLFPWMTLDHGMHLLRRVMSATRYLEWGSGGSTIAAAQLFRGERMWSVEHSEEWYARIGIIIESLKTLNVALFRRLRRSLCPHFNEYRDLPLTFTAHRYAQNWDLILVDGYEPWRSDCICAGWEHLEPSGSMLIHDAERKGVQGAIDELKLNGAQVVYDVTEGTVRLLELRKPSET